MKKPRIDILPRSGNLYKVNLHTHSTLSDGNFTPEELKELYKAEGYDAVAFTDHRVCIPHTVLTDDSFVALTGTEFDFWETDENGALFKAVHINALSMDPEKRLSVEKNVPEDSNVPMDYTKINDLIAQLKEDGFYVTLNHPVWSNMSNEDIEKVHGFDAMEVYNSIGVMFNNYSDDSAQWLYYLRSGGNAMPVAADDCHRKLSDGGPGTEYGKGFVYVKAEELTYSAIVKAIADGNFYASTGPQFQNIWLEGDILHVECSSVSGVYVQSKSIVKKTQVISRTDGITHAELDISEVRKYSPFICVQLRDTNGRKAWFGPYRFE